jgi:hypothetical protein
MGRRGGVRQKKLSHSIKKLLRRSGVPGVKGKKAKLSADDTHRIVAQHRKQVTNNPNWKKIPRLLDRFSKEQLKALSFIKS